MYTKPIRALNYGGTGSVVDILAESKGWGQREWTAVVTSLHIIVIMAVARLAYIAMASESSSSDFSKASISHKKGKIA